MKVMVSSWSHLLYRRIDIRDISSWIWTDWWSEDNVVQVCIISTVSVHTRSILEVLCQRFLAYWCLSTVSNQCDLWHQQGMFSTQLQYWIFSPPSLTTDMFALVWGSQWSRSVCSAPTSTSLTPLFTTLDFIKYQVLLAMFHSNELLQKPVSYHQFYPPPSSLDCCGCNCLFIIWCVWSMSACRPAANKLATLISLSDEQSICLFIFSMQRSLPPLSPNLLLKLNLATCSLRVQLQQHQPGLITSTWNVKVD